LPPKNKKKSHGDVPRLDGSLFVIFLVFLDHNFTEQQKRKKESDFFLAKSFAVISSTGPAWSRKRKEESDFFRQKVL